MNLPHFSGWYLLGAFPDGEPDDVGSWLLVHGGEALLLEVPPGLSVKDVTHALDRLKATLCCVTASHDHEDHLDPEAWSALVAFFPGAEFLHPASWPLGRNNRELDLNGEPLWLLKAPKHSLTDVVTVFRGVAMTGDIELAQLESVNDEVPLATKRRSMRQLQSFQERTGYHVHAIVSAHLNDVRIGIHWPDLFAVS